MENKEFDAVEITFNKGGIVEGKVGEWNEISKKRGDKKAALKHSSTLEDYLVDNFLYNVVEKISLSPYARMLQHPCIACRITDGDTTKDLVKLKCGYGF
jgi:hypothetical protein